MAVVVSRDPQSAEGLQDVDEGINAFKIKEAISMVQGRWR